MLCVFFRRWVSGNPLNCFGVVFFWGFFSVLLVLGFLCEGFFGDELLRRREVGGLIRYLLCAI